MKYTLRHKLYPSPQINTTTAAGDVRFSDHEYETDDADVARVLMKDPAIVLAKGKLPGQKPAPASPEE